MYLKRLELQGFKSFADKTVLEFKPGITSVIGPNGSGKSNISDSIRWVLGEQSMKSLRGSKAEDIIFAGTQNRKSLGFAEASIIIDNSDGKLPIEYNEVTVTRKIYRSGETGYFINKVPCRLKDILELFMDTGIGKDGYSIIGQGKIDEILSNKSEDRRHIFEEAAGIVKYRTRKMESEKKLEQTKLNLLRINDILAEIEGQLDPLKMQSEKAKKFLSLREELKNIEIGLFVFKINEYKEKISKVAEDLKTLEDQELAENTKLEEGQSQKEELKNKIEELTQAIEDMQNNAVFLKQTFEFLDIPNNMYQGSLTTEKRSDRKYEIEFRNVSFRYPGCEQYALRNINLKFKIGQKLAVVGMNGSGKTTFIKLLCRLYDPTEGKILLNGIDIRKYNYKEYMMIFSVVFQDFKLFSLTLGENVAAKINYDEEEVKSALKKSGFYNRLSTMPEGLNTYLYKDFNKKGIIISGGEAQKIAIARAIYKNAPFIILDEPTAALDPIAEAEIYEKFNEITGDKTAIYISHRLSSCKFCDKIVVFHEGSVIQTGTHQELAADKSGKYFQLWTAQAQYYR